MTDEEFKKLEKRKTKIGSCLMLACLAIWIVYILKIENDCRSIQCNQGFHPKRIIYSCVCVGESK